MTVPPPFALGAAHDRDTTPEPGVVAPVVAINAVGLDDGASGVTDDVMAAVPFPMTAVFGMIRK